MQGSSASAVLRVVSKLFPKYVDFTISEGLQTIPAFNDSNDVPPPLTKFIQLITEADAVFLCTPEYAFGASGILKNAPDWTVSSIAFYDKPVALITAASFGDKAPAAFNAYFNRISTKISGETSLLMSIVRTKLNEVNEVKDIDTFNAIKRVISSLLQTIKSNQPA